VKAAFSSTVVTARSSAVVGSRFGIIVGSGQWITAVVAMQLARTSAMELARSSAVVGSGFGTFHNAVGEISAAASSGVGMVVVSRIGTDVSGCRRRISSRTSAVEYHSNRR